jgi:hypothetical protein
MRLRRQAPRVTVTTQPDDLPRTGLFAEPVRITRLELERTTPIDPAAGDRSEAAETHEVRFLLEVRDAQGRRCPDLAIEARLTAPGRSVTVVGNTDMLGRLVVRTRGPVGSYRLEVTDVAAGGLAWDASLGPTVTAAEVTATDAG